MVSILVDAVDLDKKSALSKTSQLQKQSHMQQQSQIKQQLGNRLKEADVARSSKELHDQEEREDQLYKRFYAHRYEQLSEAANKDNSTSITKEKQGDSPQTTPVLAKSPSQPAAAESKKDASSTQEDSIDLVDHPGLAESQAKRVQKPAALAEEKIATKTEAKHDTLGGSGRAKQGVDVEFHNHKDMEGYTFNKINANMDDVKVEKVKDGDGRKCAMNDLAEIAWQGYDAEGKLLFDSKKENGGKP